MKFPFRLSSQRVGLSMWACYVMQRLCRARIDCCSAAIEEAMASAAAFVMFSCLWNWEVLCMVCCFVQQQYVGEKTVAMAFNLDADDSGFDGFFDFSNDELQAAYK